MRRLTGLLFFIGLMLVVVGTYSYASKGEDLQQDGDVQRSEGAEYIGERGCGCHQSLLSAQGDSAHSWAMELIRRDKEPILGDFEQGEELRMIKPPEEDEERPFNMDDIAYVIGKGRYLQAYLFEVERKTDFAVLPAAWDTVNQEWVPIAPDETWPESSAFDWEGECAGCHMTGQNDPEELVWEDEGVTCEACHGPGSIHADLADKADKLPDEPSAEEYGTLRAAITRTADAQVCGQCHAEGTGTEHVFPTGYRPGDDLLAEETYILAEQDSPLYWTENGYAVRIHMQFNEWFNSAHQTSLDTLWGSDSAQPECMTCHSGDYQMYLHKLAENEAGDRPGNPPAPLELDEARSGVTCVSCHNPHLIADPEVNQEELDPAERIDFFIKGDPVNLCAECHTDTDIYPGVHHPVMGMFTGQAPFEGIKDEPSPHFAADDGPDCLTCHMMELPVSTFNEQLRANHVFKPIQPADALEGQPDACTHCHENLTINDMQSLIDDTRLAVRDRLTVARARLGSVPVPDAETEPDVRALYDNVVTALDFVQNDGSMGVHNYPLADSLLTYAELTLSELSVPNANLEPTEAPKPTAIGSFPRIQTLSENPEREPQSGVRPATRIIIGLTVLIVFTSAMVIFRQSNGREV